MFRFQAVNILKQLRLTVGAHVAIPKWLGLITGTAVVKSLITVLTNTAVGVGSYGFSNKIRATGTYSSYM